MRLPVRLRFGDTSGWTGQPGTGNWRLSIGYGRYEYDYTEWPMYVVPPEDFKKLPFVWRGLKRWWKALTQ